LAFTKDILGWRVNPAGSSPAGELLSLAEGQHIFGKRFGLLWHQESLYDFSRSLNDKQGVAYIIRQLGCQREGVPLVPVAYGNGHIGHDGTSDPHRMAMASSWVA
jgi:hypothetical protein